MSNCEGFVLFVACSKGAILFPLAAAARVLLVIDCRLHSDLLITRLGVPELPVMIAVTNKCNRLSSTSTRVILI